MFDLGLNLTMQAVGRQLAAMPHDLYLVRLIHGQTRRAFPGERLWTAAQLTYAATLRFLRARNREGCDVYIQPYAADRNPGYILVDLDHNGPAILEAMRNHGHEPCVVLQTSPGNLQAWVRVSAAPIEPAIASVVGKHLAHAYGGDLASTDWRHLGRLAGFTNKKPQRRDGRGYSPWVKVLHAHAGLASQSAALLQEAEHCVAGPANMSGGWMPGHRACRWAAVRCERFRLWLDANPYYGCVRRCHIYQNINRPTRATIDEGADSPARNSDC